MTPCAGGAQSSHLNLRGLVWYVFTDTLALASDAAVLMSPPPPPGSAFGRHRTDGYP